jgi:hypothetical protein
MRSYVWNSTQKINTILLHISDIQQHQNTNKSKDEQNEGSHFHVVNFDFNSDYV